MTSVQNRLQQLSGNNLLVFLLLIASISSCASKKITSTNKVEVVSIQTKSAQVSSTAEAAAKKRYEDSISKLPVIFDLDNSSNQNNTTNTNTKPSVKNNQVANNDPNRIHNIAVMLPFFLDQISLGQYVDDSTKQLGNDSKNAMEFYLGCQMAREQFESEHLNTNVYFLDDRNDSATTASLFKMKPFPNIDYIIGPLYFKNLKTAADLAKSNQIPLISPLASSMYIKDNPYYFNATASFKSQYAFILEHAKSKFPGKTLEVIYDSKDSTAENIELLKAISEKYYGYNDVKFLSYRATDDIAKAMYQTDTTSERIILIYSNKDSYSKSVIAKLKTIKNKLHIFNSSAVRFTKSLADLKYPHAIYTVHPYNTENPNYTVLAPKYEEKHKKKTSETVNQAYDLMMYLFSMMDKNQLLTDNTYSYSANFNNTHTKFQFKPVLNKNGEVDYYDNTFLYLYKYASGSFIIVTP
jgi:ABC-type branched-subunit amino acid transport system substrate-binding protein